MVSRRSRILVSLLPLLLSAALMRALPLMAQSDPPVLPSAPPPEIAVTLLLGDNATRALTLTNPGASPQTVTLYEANASAPPDSVPLEREFAVPLPPTTTAFLVYLNESADLRPAYAIADWEARGEFVYHALTEEAARSQARLQQELTRRGYAFHSFWIVNALYVEGDAQLAEWVAQQPEVAAVAPDQRYARDLPVPEETGDSVAPGALAWHLKRTGAADVWRDFGIEGAGITVAALDSGAMWRHTALMNSYRGNDDGVIDHNYHWIDVAGTPAAPAPLDPLGHGTHVLGIMAARRGDDIVQTGIAPRARWIAVRGCGEIFCQQHDVLEAAQWLIAPTDLNRQNPRPDLRPHIINNSWGFSQGGSGWFEGAMAAWRAAGIFATFAAGNDGPNCGAIDTPALSAAAFAVGATAQDDTVAPFSARGPAYDGRIKPDLTAPGASVYAPYGNGRFVVMSGTSMASPMVAGAVALLWSGNPALVGDVAATEAILRESATPLFAEECGSGAQSLPNNSYGAGLLNIHAAVRTANVDVPWLDVPSTVTIPPGATITLPVRFDAGRVGAFGTYHARLAVMVGGALQHTAIRMTVLETPDVFPVAGQLLDAENGAGLSGTVTFANGNSVTSAQDGTFSTLLPSGNQVIHAQAAGYLPFTTTVLITEVSYITLPLIVDIPRIELIVPQQPLEATLDWGESVTHTLRVGNRGTQPLVVTPTIPGDEWQVTPLTFTTPYQLEHYQVLRLGNEQVYTRGILMPFQIPLFGRYVTRLYPTANGWIAPVHTLDARRTVGCLPTGFAYEGMIAPFWADLDPSQGGTIKAGLADRDTFVISYEGIPLRDPAGTGNAPRYTFQAVFNADGTVEYRYGQMGTLPSQWAVGMNGAVGQATSLACADEPRLLTQQGWQLRNQSSPRLWSAVSEEPLVLAPGEGATVVVTLRGVAPSPWLDAPMRARVRLESNDPRQPITDIETRLTVGEAPYHLWIGMSGRRAYWNYE